MWALLYAGSVAYLAAAGGMTGDGHFYVAAFVLTLPLGFPAAIGVYFGYALIQWAGGLFIPVTTASGDQASWLRLGTGVLAIVLFTSAAVGNIVVPRVVLRAVRRSR
jgi:hypothetical protein